MWCVGEVIEVADGKRTKKSAKCKSVLPWGAVRIKYARPRLEPLPTAPLTAVLATPPATACTPTGRWPTDEEFDEEESYTWTILKPADFNKEVNLGWRYEKSELAKMKAAANP